jgi:hypothetical protein
LVPEDATGHLGPIEEWTSGDWGIGGRALTTEDAKALAAGTPAWHPNPARSQLAIR